MTQQAVTWRSCRWGLIRGMAHRLPSSWPQPPPGSWLPAYWRFFWRLAPSLPATQKLVAFWLVLPVRLRQRSLSRSFPHQAKLSPSEIMKFSPLQGELWPLSLSCHLNYITSSLFLNLVLRPSTGLYHQCFFPERHNDIREKGFIQLDWLGFESTAQ